jgi:hypothetical protein
MREDKGLYCECVGGAVSLNEYVEMMKRADYLKESLPQGYFPDPIIS